MIKLCSKEGDYMTIKELINKGILVLKKNNVEYPKLKSTLTNKVK